MLNLIPSEQKKVLEREYASRRLIVWAVICIVVLAVFLILLVPSYILSKTRVSGITAELEQTKRILDTELQPNEVTVALSDAARNARDLAPFVEKASVYSLIKIFESKPAAIKITRVTFEEKPAEPSVISVAGIASDRESLRTFGRLMEARTEFVSVDLPVSNFAKEKDIDFSMRLIVK